MFWFLFYSFLWRASATFGPFSRHGRPSHDLKCTTDCGEAPLLSEIFKAKGPTITKNESRVDGIGDIESYAGFLTVDAAVDSNMFFWYFPAQSGKADAPLLIWLQGGPGGSSLFGLFSEMGPFTLDENLTVHDRPVTWNKNYAMLFIDNPVGAGFSYTLKDEGYCTNQEMVADNLFEFMKQFYLVFPEEQQVPLYITGESYGGHYVPSFAYKIHQNPEANIPLAGLAIGDGWIDPVNMIGAYPAMMYNQGLIDETQRVTIQDYCDRTVAFIKAGQMLDAFNVWDQMLNGDVWPYANYFHNITGSNDYDNYLNTNAPDSFGYAGPYVSQDDVRKKIHVGNRTYQDGSVCEHHLLADFMVSMKPRLEVLLDNYKVLIYSGQLDVIIGAALTEAFLPGVEWSGQAEYNAAKRKVWRMTDSDPEVAGYVRVVKNFSQVIIRGAGHIAPYDQPERTMDMIDRFVLDIPYKNLPDPL